MAFEASKLRYRLSEAFLAKINYNKSFLRVAVNLFITSGSRCTWGQK